MKNIKSVTIFLLILTSINFIYAADDFHSYNIELEIPEEYQTVSPGQKLWFTVKTFNLANEDRMDVILNYVLYDSQSNKIAEKSETVAIQTQASFVNSIIIPPTTPEGTYLLSAEIVDQTGKNKITTANVSVLKEKNTTTFIIDNLPWIILVIVLFTLLILFFKFKSRIKILKEKILIKRKIKNIIKLKIDIVGLSKSDLKNSRLPSRKTNEEDLVF